MLAVAALSCAVTAARSDTPTFGTLNTSLTPSIRTAVAHALRQLGENNPDRIADEARTFRLLTCVGQESCFVQIRDAKYCDGNLCLTMILAAEPNREVNVKAMFYAADRGGMNEPSEKDLGPTICFGSDDRMVCIIKTALGWIIH